MMVRNAQPRPYLTLRDAMDRFFESGLAASRGPWQVQWSRGLTGQPVNVFEDEASYHVQALVPGVDPEQLEITAHPNNRLTIAGVTKTAAPENARAVWSEFGELKFQRELALALPFDAEKAKVTYQQGVLEIVLPKREEARPRQIKVLPAAAE
jgi:HSP20 family protein